jgi:hypothetical protein
MYLHRRPEPSDRFSWTSPWRHLLPCRLGGVLILCLILFGCVLPTVEDLSGREKINSSEIKNAINSAFYCHELRLLDFRYVAYTQEELLECLNTGKWIASLPYIPEHHDCEEFLFESMAWIRGQLYGIPFGLGFRDTPTSTHAENIFVDNNLTVWVVDIKRHGCRLIPASNAFYFLVMI